MRKIELLAPAGDLERLKIAVMYGADAVYIGGEIFGLRAAAKNFTLEEMAEGVAFAHEHGVRVYVTANIIPHNEDLQDLPEYVKALDQIGVDALIVSDPGTLMMVQEAAPNMEIHISTQANNTNYQTANFWYKQGAKRVVLARELSFDEVREIREKTPEDLEIEAFVHGAMCISYSGRCLLSNYMAHRDANRGECAQPCRWKYHLVEEKRPGEYMPIYEDAHGTYIMNSKDLCMIEYIPQLIEAGIDSLKIEGRMKTTFYVATVVGAYRAALDSYLENPEGWTCKQEWLEEIRKASHRDFTTGFYQTPPKHTEHLYSNQSYVRNYDFIAIVLDYDENTGLATVEQRNRFFVGDKIEVMQPKMSPVKATIEAMFDEEGNPIEVAPHPKQIVKLKLNLPTGPYAILRREKGEEE